MLLSLLKKYIPVLVLLFFMTSLLYGQRVQMALDQDHIALGEALTLQVEVEGKLEGALELPPINDVEVQGSGQSTSISWINGDYSKKVIYTYSLYPQKKGVFQIPSFEVSIDGEKVKTEALTFKVSEESSPERARGEERGDAEESDSENESLPVVFVERQLSKLNPYEGEPIISEVKIFHRVELASAAPVAELMEGVRVLNIDERRSREKVDSYVYDVISLRQVFIPLKPGKLVIPPYKIRLHVVLPTQRKQRNRDNFFEDFFNMDRGRVVQKLATSRPDELKVMAVPQEGRPQDFKGVVGDFKLSSSLSSQTLKVGETTTLTLDISGHGLLDMLGVMQLDLGPKVKVYNDKPKIVEKVDPVVGVYSQRVYKFALVPKEAGSIELKDYTMTFFNPTTQKFQTLKASFNPLQVTPSDEVSVVVKDAQSHQNLGDKADNKTQVKTVGTDLVDIHRAVVLKSDVLLKDDLFKWLGLALVSSMVVIVSLLLQFKRRRGFAKGYARRKSRAYKSFKDKINSYAALKNEEKLQRSFQAYKDFLGDKLNIQGQALTVKDIERLFQEHRIEQNLILKSTEMISQVEHLLFSGKSLSEEQAKSLLAEMHQHVQELEKSCLS